MALTSSMEALEANLAVREGLSAEHAPPPRPKSVRAVRNANRRHNGPISRMGRDNLTTDLWLLKVDAQLKETNDALDRIATR